MKKTLTLDKESIDALSSVLVYLFEHETEDYIEHLLEVYPEDEEYINKVARSKDSSPLDDYVTRKDSRVNHIYGPAYILFKAMQASGVTAQ